MKTYFSFLHEKKQDNESNLPLTARDILLEDIKKTQHALETAYAGFDNATDPDLIDCYIYEVNSALKRYRFLLNQAQRMHVFVSETNEKELLTTSLVNPGRLAEP